MPLKNIQIRYEVDDEALEGLVKKLQDVTDAEVALLAAFRQTNAAFAAQAQAFKGGIPGLDAAGRIIQNTPAVITAAASLPLSPVPIPNYIPALKAEQDFQRQKQALQKQTFDLFRTLSDGQLQASKARIDEQIALNSAEIETAKQRASVLAQLIEQTSGAQRSALQKQQAVTLATIEAEQQANTDLANQKARLDREAAVRAKALAIIEATINTALSVSKALGTPPAPNVAAAAIAGALGAVQVATIAAQPLSKGTVAVTGGIPGKDSVPALLTPGEAVIPADVARANQPLIARLVNKLPVVAPTFQNTPLTSAFSQTLNLDALKSAIEQNTNATQQVQAAIQAKPIAVIQADIHGFRIFEQQAHHKTEYLNRRYP